MLRRPVGQHLQRFWQMRSARAFAPQQCVQQGLRHQRGRAAHNGVRIGIRGLGPIARSLGLRAQGRIKGLANRRPQLLHQRQFGRAFCALQSGPSHQVQDRIAALHNTLCSKQNRQAGGAQTRCRAAQKPDMWAWRKHAHGHGPTRHFSSPQHTFGIVRTLQHPQAGDGRRRVGLCDWGAGQHHGRASSGQRNKQLVVTRRGQPQSQRSIGHRLR